MSLQYITNGTILLPNEAVLGRSLVVDTESGRIVGLADTVPEGAECIDATGLYVAPGLIDLHIHGYLGADASDADPEGLRKMAQGIAKNGVTSFLPTTMTLSEDALLAAFDAVRAVMNESRAWDGAEILGVHAEGPFINPKKKGAQDGQCIRTPSAAFVLKNADVIRLLTLAPEMDADHACIKELARDGRILLSMGHTDASFEEAMRAIEDGVCHATHLFNAMSPLAHREPGVVGAALASGVVSAELIADTLHVHTGLFSLVAKAKGEKLILITDCTRAGGMPDGEYTLGGQSIFLRDGACRLADGTLAGSVLKLDRAVWNMHIHAGIPLYEAVRMASLNPASAIGMADRLGSLEEGKDADLILADASFGVVRTIKRGRTVYCAKA